MEKKKAIKTAIIITLSLGLLIWGINFLKNKNVFKPADTFYGVYNKIDGLTVSSAVTLNGFKIGQVSDINFLHDNSGKLVVGMQINNPYKIVKGSVAQIYSIDIMGTKGVNIIIGENPKEKANSGDTLKTAIEGDLKEQVNMQILPLKMKAEELIGSVDSVLTVIKTIFDNRTRENLAQSFNSIKVTLSNLENATYTLDTLLSTEKNVLAAILGNAASFTQNLEDNNEDITTLIQNFTSLSDTLADADIANVIKNADKTMADLNIIIEKVNTGKGSVGMLINNDTLYKNIENSTYNLNRLLRDIRENPKRYVRFSAFDLGVINREKKKKD